MAIQIYCDGACSGNPGPGGWGSVIDLGDRIVELGAADPQTTNNRMELLGLITSFEHIGQAAGAIEVVTDSSYVIQGATQWVFNWKRSGWMTKEGKPVANQDLWIRLDDLLNGLGRSRVKFTWVKGHAGHQGNERADAIAEAFSKSKPMSLYVGSRKEYPIQNLSELSTYPVYLSIVGGKLERHKTWAECETRVKGTKGSKFKKVTHAGEEAEWLQKINGA